MKNIFLDDERLPNLSFWTHTKTVEETIELLENNTDVGILSLDHDLGTVSTGYDVLTWIEKQVFLHGWKPPEEIWIHTSNPSAGIKMWSALKKIKEYSKFPLGIDYKSGDSFWWQD